MDTQPILYLMRAAYFPITAEDFRMKLFDGTTAVELYKKAVDALQDYMEGVYVCVCMSAC